MSELEGNERCSSLEERGPECVSFARASRSRSGTGAKVSHLPFGASCRAASAAAQPEAAHSPVLSPSLPFAPSSVRILSSPARMMNFSFPSHWQRALPLARIG